MRPRTAALLAALPSLLALGACAPRRGSEALAHDPREIGVAAPPGAEDVLLFTSHRIAGCRYRAVGELSSATQAGLRDGAVQKMAHAVVDVRREVTPTPRTPGQGTQIRPAATVHYTGLAVRFAAPGCPGAGAAS